MPDPYTIATWRYDQIAVYLDESLPEALRTKRLKEASRESVVWPSGDVRPIGQSTLYRWIEAYRKNGLAGLLPKERKDKGSSRKDRSAAVSYAIGLLMERPDRSLTQLLEYVRLRFPESRFSRSTLSRELKKHPAYGVVIRNRRGGRLRRRFEAVEPHELWQMDAKGPFPVRLKDGRGIRVVVLSILDDCTRYVLAAGISRSESIAGAVRVFRAAAMSWGLPRRIYCDRLSVYDSDAFRKGLAELGVYRIKSKPRSKEARGKIERYHRTLNEWFVKELPHQEIIDETHLEELLQATLDILYHRRKHRALGCSPAEALGHRVSKRQVAPEDLHRAFWITARKKAHPKTGEVELQGCLYQVPPSFAGNYCQFTYDPVEIGQAFLVTNDGRRIPLEPIRKQHPAPRPQEPRRGAGQLQQILDEWRGRKLPIASPGFGLPELFEVFSQKLNRNIPATEEEAETLQRFYSENGPFAPQPFKDALARIVNYLGPDRPLQIYIRQLKRFIDHGKSKED